MLNLEGSSDCISNLPSIVCKCGAKILLVPDLASMNWAIEGHLDEHKSNAKDPEVAKKVDDLREHLIVQVFEKIIDAQKSLH